MIDITKHLLVHSLSGLIIDDCYEITAGGYSLHLKIANDGIKYYNFNMLYESTFSVILKVKFWTRYSCLI